MAEAIRNEQAHYDGFVIAHGTDTMAYTAAALSFMLVVLAEVSFWLSVIILGRGAIEKFRKIEGNVQPNDQQDPDR